MELLAPDSLRELLLKSTAMRITGRRASDVHDLLMLFLNLIYLQIALLWMQMRVALFLPFMLKHCELGLSSLRHIPGLLFRTVPPQVCWFPFLFFTYKLSLPPTSKYPIRVNWELWELNLIKTKFDRAGQSLSVIFSMN